MFLKIDSFKSNLFKIVYDNSSEQRHRLDSSTKSEPFLNTSNEDGTTRS